MSVVSLLGVQLMNNPAKFTDKYEFEITFECLEQLEKGKVPYGDCLVCPFFFQARTDRLPDLEWKLTYVGSATRLVDLPQASRTLLTVLAAAAAC